MNELIFCAFYFFLECRLNKYREASYIFYHVIHSIYYIFII